MSKTIPQNDQAVGVIGVGDLGRRLVVQLLLAGRKVMIYDLKPVHLTKLDLAVDPLLNTSKLSTKLLTKASAQEILDSCAVVHFAAPSSNLGPLPKVPASCVVMLADSVMANSVKALKKRTDSDNFVLAHCLMNDDKRVLVSTDYGKYKDVVKHFASINLAPKTTNVAAHDSLMARTQGVFALLVGIGIRKQLDQAYANGDLTPSAVELHDAVINREAHWTDITIKSILANPELKPFVEDMATLLKDPSKHK